MNTKVQIQNLKCSGCEATILRKLSELDNIDKVIVSQDDNTVSFNYKAKKDVEMVKNTLKKLGYPLEGVKNRLDTKAKSYVSCAIGRISK